MTKHANGWLSICSSLVGASLVVPAAILLASSRQAEPREVISGRVITFIGREAVADARVVLTPVQRRGEPLGREAFVRASLEGSSPKPITVTSGHDGSFSIAAPPGEYSLTARKSGMLGGHFGQNGPFDEIQYFDLRPNEKASGITLFLWAGATVAGTVRNQDRAPIANWRVQAMRLATDEFGGGIRFVLAGWAVETDEFGRFRISGLEPGQYTLKASKAVRQLLIGRDTPALMAPDDVFYRGTSSLATASLISAEPNVEYAGVDIDFPETSKTDISIAGRLVGEIDRCVGQPARLVLTSPAGPFPAGFEVATTAISGGGYFKFSPITAGLYDIKGHCGSTGTKTPGEGGLSWFSRSVAITDRSIADLAVPLERGFRLSGQLTGSVSPPTALKVSPIDTWNQFDRVPETKIDSEGHFVTPELPPGRYALSAVRPGSLLTASVLVGKRDVTATGVEVIGANVSDVIVNVTSQRALITGVVTDASGRPRPDAHVFAFGSPIGQVGVREAFRVRPDRFGNYKIELPAPECYVIAVTGALPSDWRSLAFFTDLSRLALHVRLEQTDHRRETLIAVPLKR